MIIRQEELFKTIDSPHKNVLCAVVFQALDDVSAGIPAKPNNAHRIKGWLRYRVEWRMHLTDAVDFLTRRMHEQDSIYIHLNIEKGGVIKKVRELLQVQETTIEKVLEAHLHGGSMGMKYKKRKPDTVDVLQYKNNFDEVEEFAADIKIEQREEKLLLTQESLEMWAKKGDIITKDSKGKFCVFVASKFKANYELASEDDLRI